MMLLCQDGSAHVVVMSGWICAGCYEVTMSQHMLLCVQVGSEHVVVRSGFVCAGCCEVRLVLRSLL